MLSELPRRGVVAEGPRELGRLRPGRNEKEDGGYAVHSSHDRTPNFTASAIITLPDIVDNFTYYGTLRGVALRGTAGKEGCHSGFARPAGAP